MMKMNSKRIVDYLDRIIVNPICELNYSKDYELVIAVMMSAQSTDKRVNQVTKELYSKYSTIELLDKAPLVDIMAIIKPVGTHNRKAVYIKQIVHELKTKSNGIVPNDRKFLERLPGIGRKSTNVILSELYNVPTIAVDTHVTRVSKRLGLAGSSDDPLKIEKKLMNVFKQTEWNKINHQLILFGRYHCKAKKPDCLECLLKADCKKENL